MYPGLINSIRAAAKDVEVLEFIRRNPGKSASEIAARASLSGYMLTGLEGVSLSWSQQTISNSMLNIGEKAWTSKGS